MKSLAALKQEIRSFECLNEQNIDRETELSDLLDYQKKIMKISLSLDANPINREHILKGLNSVKIYQLLLKELVRLKEKKNHFKALKNHMEKNIKAGEVPWFGSLPGGTYKELGSTEAKNIKDHNSIKFNKGDKK